MRPIGWSLLIAASLTVTVAACGDGQTMRVAPVEEGVEHGLVLTTTTDHYVVVLDIIPPEVMYTPAELAKARPSEGELVIRGRSTDAHAEHTRHVEVHVYDRATGRVVTGATPQLTFVDHTAGRATVMDATEMRDVDLGDLDIHYGSNLPVPHGHEFTVQFRLGADAADFRGTLA